MIKQLLILLILNAPLIHTVCAEDTVLEVIPLYNRPASEIQPLLDPLLEKSDRIIADGANLLVRTTPERLVEIKELLQKLDKPLNNLLITVLQSSQATAEELNARIRIHRQAPGGSLSRNSDKVSGYVYQTQDRSENDNQQIIRTLEGKPAYIKAGNNYPVENYQSYNSGYGYSGYSSSTQFVEATTGFAVTPRLSGQQVFLDISPWSDNLNAQGQIQTQGAETTLKVNLGEWVELGGIDQSSQSSGNRTLARSWQTQDTKLHILIKVDKTQ
jgi:type II secretory pathway component GspD/PulD (secretin)